MLSQVVQCEHAMEKSVLIHNMNLKDKESYEKLAHEIGRFSIHKLKLVS